MAKIFLKHIQKVAKTIWKYAQKVAKVLIVFFIYGNNINNGGYKNGEIV